jgi:hypothetical protein
VKIPLFPCTTNPRIASTNVTLIGKLVWIFIPNDLYKREYPLFTMDFLRGRPMYGKKIEMYETSIYRNGRWRNI